MLRKNNKLYFFLFVLLSMLCIPVTGEGQEAKEPAAGESTPDKPTVSEPATTDIWSSIESTIQALADPFIPQILKKEMESVAPPASPAVAVPKTPPKPTVKPAVMIPGSLTTTEGAAPPPALPAIHVSGVMYNTDMPMAIINGQLYAIGETLTSGNKGDGIVKLKAVHAESIEVDFMGEKHTISLEGK